MIDTPLKTPETKSEQQPSTPSAAWKAVSGYAIAALCLAWVFHDVQIKELIGSMSAINWWWVSAAVIFDILSYVCQGLRWSLLLHPVGRISIFQSTEAIYAGLFVNEILPMRPGEVLRAYLISRWTAARFAFVVSSILVERYFDAIWLALAFGITVLIVPLPKYLVQAEEILGFTALGATILFVFLVFRKKPSAAAPAESTKGSWRPARWVSELFNKLAGGIRDIGRSRNIYSSFAVSLFLLLGQILSFWLVMLACGLKLSFWHGAAIFLIVHVGTAIPSAPSNIGTYQFFTVVGLTLFGVDKTAAASFSIIVFLILTLPLWVIGMLAFGRLGLHIKTIRSEIASLARR